jgi:hypothetical protein
VLKALLPDELLDELLAGARTEEGITGPGGLLSRLTKRLVERALEVELTGHLGYEPRQEPPGGAGNTRNGSTPKTFDHRARRGADRDASRPEGDVRAADGAQAAAAVQAWRNSWEYITPFLALRRLIPFVDSRVLSGAAGSAPTLVSVRLGDRSPVTHSGGVLERREHVVGALGDPRAVETAARWLPIRGSRGARRRSRARAGRARAL